MKTQIEQYNKKENATTQHQASQQTYYPIQAHPKHEAKIQTMIPT